MTPQGVLLIALTCALGAGCGALRGAPTAPEVGRLRVQMTDVAIEGRGARLSGMVTNEYAARVDGVRYLVVVRDADDSAREFERFEREADTTIEPNGRAPMSLEVASDAFNEQKFRIAITATPLKLDGRDFTPPDS